jgi:polyphosphate glucokinase
MQVLGIDVGGSGIKGAVVDTLSGSLCSERQRIKTPQPATPEGVADVVARMARHFAWEGPIGCGFPAALRGGVACTASNIDRKWLGTDVSTLFSKATSQPVFALNDADAAGLAEIRFGAGAGEMGTVIVVTVGTGLGTAIFLDGKLLPNTELGHIKVKGVIAEHYASASARKEQNLPWPRWGRRFNRYLRTLERLFWPDLFIVGGGYSNRFQLFAPHLDLNTRAIPAGLLNHAGIVGAALYARSCCTVEISSPVGTP